MQTITERTFCEGHVRSHRIHFRVQGSGSCKLLLVNGFQCPGEEFEYQLRHFLALKRFQVPRSAARALLVLHANRATWLAAHGRHAQVCTIDNRGSGASTRPHVPHITIADMARDVLAVLNHVQWTEGVHLVGISMGGMVAQEVVLLAPTRFTSLTLIATHAGGLRAFVTPAGAARVLWCACLLPAPAAGCWPYPRPPPRRVGAALTNQARVRRMMHLLYSSSTLKRDTSHARLAQFHTEQLTRNGPHSLLGAAAQVAGIMQHMLSWEQLLRLRYWEGKTQIIVGEEDLLVPTWNSHALGRWLGAPVHVVQGGGHVLISEHPEQVNRLIQEHIEQAEAERAALLWVSSPLHAQHLAARTDKAAAGTPQAGAAVPAASPHARPAATLADKPPRGRHQRQSALQRHAARAARQRGPGHDAKPIVGRSVSTLDMRAACRPATTQAARADGRECAGDASMEAAWRAAELQDGEPQSPSPSQRQQQPQAQQTQQPLTEPDSGIANPPQRCKSECHLAPAQEAACAVVAAAVAQQPPDPRVLAAALRRLADARRAEPVLRAACSHRTLCVVHALWQGLRTFAVAYAALRVAGPLLPARWRRAFTPLLLRAACVLGGAQVMGVSLLCVVRRLRVLYLARAAGLPAPGLAPPLGSCALALLACVVVRRVLQQGG